MAKKCQTQVSAAGYTMQAMVQVIGSDVLVVVTGGDHPHIGAVTMAAAGQSIQTIRYPSHDGRLHKDNYLSERVAKQLIKQVPGSLTVTAGMHVDHISKVQLDAAGPLVDRLSQQIADWLSPERFQQTPPVYYRTGEQPQ